MVFGHAWPPGPGARSSNPVVPRAVTGFRTDIPAQRENLPRCARLSKSAQFREIFARGERGSTREFHAFFKSNGSGCPRIGLAVSKRNAPLSVQRSRLKRLIRESFRKHQGSLRGLDIVVLVNPRARTTDSAALLASLEELWVSLENTKLGQPCRERTTQP